MQVVKYREKGQQRIGAIAADLPVKGLLEVPLDRIQHKKCCYP